MQQVCACVDAASMHLLTERCARACVCGRETWFTPTLRVCAPCTVRSRARSWCVPIHALDGAALRCCVFAACVQPARRCCSECSCSCARRSVRTLISACVKQRRQITRDRRSAVIHAACTRWRVVGLSLVNLRHERSPATRALHSRSLCRLRRICFVLIKIAATNQEVLYAGS